MKRAEIIISGEVQEAGYRAYVRKCAQKLKLVGFVENLPDGTVKVVVEGTEDKIQLFYNQLKIKTPTIEVENIELKYMPPTGEFDGRGFKVKISDIGEELFQGYATAAKYFTIGFEKQDSMLEKQDRMLEKQDRMLEKQDRMLEKQDRMLEKQDKMLEKQDKMLEKQDKMLEKQDRMLEKQDELLTAVKSMHNDMKDGFSHLESSLGSKIESMHKDMNESFSHLESSLGGKIESMHKDMNESFSRLDKTYGKFGEKMESLEKDIREMKELFAKFVDHYIRNNPR